jgi:HEAT repeat protein
MQKMIADYMENGFLDNIVDMFKHDNSLYGLIGNMLGDERGRVRLGTVALVEILKTKDFDNVLTAIPGIAVHLKNPNPTIRGDAAYVLGIIGHKDAVKFLSEASDDENEMVREAVKDSIETINSAGSLTQPEETMP